MANKRLFFIVLTGTIIVLLPIVFLFVESFKSETGGVSFAPMRSLVLTSRQIGLMKNSLILAGGATIFSLLLGVPLSFLIKRTDLPFKRFFNWAYLVPLIIPPYIHAIIWVKFFNSHLATIWHFIMPGLKLPSIYSLPGGVFVFTLSFFPFVTLIASSGLNSIDRSLEEASYMNRGVSKTIGRITVPLLTPHITSAAILVFVFTVINFEVPDILRLRVYPIEIFINFSAFYNERAATILSAPLILVTFIMIWGQMLYMGKKSYANSESTERGTALFRLGKSRTASLIYSGALITLSALIPIVLLIQGAGGLRNYIEAFNTSKDKIFYSIYVAGLSSLIMVTFSFAVAYYIERSRSFAGRILDFLTQTPFGVPSIVLGIGLIKVWNREGFDWIYGTTLILLIAYITGYSPFVIRVILTKVRQIGREMEEAAIMADRNWASVVGRVVFPLALPGIVAGFFTGFVLSIANLGTALLVVAPGRGTMPISIYNFMHYGAENMIFALSLVLIILMALSVAALYPLYRFSTNKAGA